MSSKHLTLKPESRQSAAMRSSLGVTAPWAFAEPHQLHAVVMGVAGRHDRGAEAPDHADDHTLLAQNTGDLRRAAEAVWMVSTGVSEPSRARAPEAAASTAVPWSR